MAGDNPAVPAGANVRMAQLLEKLLPKFMGVLSPSGSEQQLRYLSRIITSYHTESYGSMDEDQLVQMVYRRAHVYDELAIADKQGTREKVDELMALLRRLPTLSHRAEIVTLLCDISGQKGEDNSGLAGLMQPRAYDVDSKRKQAHVQGKENIALDGKNVASSGKPYFPDKPRQKVVKSSAQLKQDSFRKLLVRDVLFAFQGIDGHLVQFNSAEQSFKIAAIATITRPMRQLALELCEMGWMFRHVSSFLDKALNNPQLGLVSHSFASAVREELQDYYRLIAVLETHLSSDEADVAGQASEGRPLSLRRLKTWTFEPFRKLKLIAELVDAVDGLSGGALASVVHGFTLHGDPFVRNFAETVMQQVARPIFEFIRQWITHGELEDVHGEFFVSSKPKVSFERLWFDKYSIHSAMVPGFIGPSLAAKVLSVGKTINFLRYCCKESTFFQNDLIEMELDANAFRYEITQREAETTFREANIHEAVDAVAARTHQALIATLFKDYHLLEHCRALKQYLLLGQGDTIQYLMDLLSSYLSKPANQVFRHSLNAQLETAIRASNARGENEDILKRLDVRILEASPGDSGWDVFALDYHVTPPINTIVRSDSMQKYLEIFTFLWKLKRVEHSLSSTWKQHMTAEHSVREIEEIRGVLQKSHVLRNEMIHFTSNLHNYIMFEVLETSWENLVHAFRSAKDLDQLVKAHDTYLDTIISKSLIGPAQSIDPHEAEDEGQGLDHSQLRQILYVLFDLIIKFCGVQRRLYTRIMAHVHRMHQARQKIYERTQAGKWGIGSTEEEEETQEGIEAKKISGEYNAQLHEISQDYRRTMQQFLDALKSSSAMENLRFLRFRLDFNLFYQP